MSILFDRTMAINNAALFLALESYFISKIDSFVSIVGFLRNCFHKTPET